MSKIKLPDYWSATHFRQSLDASWKEGIATSVMVAIIDEYLIPFGLFLGATPLDIGFLVAIPHLLGSLSQFLAAASVGTNSLVFILDGEGHLVGHPDPGRVVTKSGDGVALVSAAAVAAHQWVASGGRRLRGAFREPAD